MANENHVALRARHASITEHIIDKDNFIGFLASASINADVLVLDPRNPKGLQGDPWLYGEVLPNPEISTITVQEADGTKTTMSKFSAFAFGPSLDFLPGTNIVVKSSIELGGNHLKQIDFDFKDGGGRLEIQGVVLDSNGDISKAVPLYRFTSDHGFTKLPSCCFPKLKGYKKITVRPVDASGSVDVTFNMRAI